MKMSNIFTVTLLLIIPFYLIIAQSSNSDLVKYNSWDEKNNLAYHTNNSSSINIDLDEFVDSILIYDEYGNSSKWSYSYDSHGRKLKYLIQVRNIDDWLNQKKYSYLYDESGNYIKYSSQIWDNKWKIFEQDTTIYTKNENVLTITQMKWDSTKWVNYFKTIETYNKNDQLILRMREEWKNNKWTVYYTRSSYSYDSLGRRIVFLGEVLEDGSWINAYKYIYDYDSHDNVISELSLVWDTNKWNNSTIETYEYNENNDYVKVIDQRWDDSSWVKAWFGELSYDNFGNNIFSISKRGYNNEWEDIVRRYSKFDGANNKIEFLEEYWRDSLWINESKVKYNYDINGNLIQANFQKWVLNNWENKNGYFSFPDNQNRFYSIEGMEIKIYYGNLTKLNPSDNSILQYSLSQNYPNPFNATSTIRYSISSSNRVQLFVYDVLGRKVLKLVDKFQLKGNYQVRFDASSFSSGTYYYQIVSGDFTKTNKLILLK